MGSGASGIQGTQSTLAGTYLAEQTAPGSYTLTSADDGKKQHTATSSSSSSKRNKRTLHGAAGADVCTVLPALTKLEPLLDSSEDAFWPAATPVTPWNRTAPQKSASKTDTTGAVLHVAESSTGSKEEPVASKSPNAAKALKYKAKGPPRDPEKVFDRLTKDAEKRKARKKRGISPPPRRAASPESTLTYENEEESADDLATWGYQFRLATTGSKTPTQMSVSPEPSRHLSMDSGGYSRESPEPSRSSSRARSHISHHALFDEALQRTGSACRANSPHGGRQYAPSFWVGKRSKTLQEQLQNINVLPEDSVKTFFENEQRKQEEFRRQSLIEEKKTARRSMLQNAVTKTKELNQSLNQEALKPSLKTTEWDNLLDSVMVAKKISPAAREACEAMRAVVLGPDPPADQMSSREAHQRSYLSSVGPEDQIFQVWRFWRNIDDDNSGRVDFREFRSHLQTMPKDIATLAEKSMKQLLMKKSSFTVEDVLKVLWPCADAKNLANMKAQLDDFGSANHRRQTPPLISDDDLREMIENFQYFDKDASGSVTCQELLESGLLDEEQATRFMRDFDSDGSGEISVWEFCEMFCPVGFRAYPEAHHATDSEGNRLVYEEGWGWRSKILGGASSGNSHHHHGAKRASETKTHS